MASNPARKRPTPKARIAATKAARAAVDPAHVTLVRTKGTVDRGGGFRGEAWRIDFGAKRAGIVFINFVDQAPIGPHASVQIYVNAASQGRGIGRVAYRAACEASEHATIYAHIRTSNIASRRAAEAAGFTYATDVDDRQTVMVWKKE